MSEQELWDKFVEIVYASYLIISCRADEEQCLVPPSSVNGIGFYGHKMFLMRILHDNLYYGSILQYSNQSVAYSRFPHSPTPNWTVLEKCELSRQEMLRELAEAYPEFSVLELLYA